MQGEQATEILSALGKGGSTAFFYNFRQWYLPDSPQIQLLVVALADDNEHGKIWLLVAEANEPVVAAAVNALAGVEISQAALTDLARACQVPLVDLSQPLKLEPVSIPKPWGQEIWYTGIEQRGLSLVSDGNYAVPLAWLIGILPGYLTGVGDQPPNLLKILDPLPDPVYGDLYFELHQEKREVYVVTHVDKEAWPDGIGGIRYGFSDEMRKRFDNDRAFRSAYRDAVKAYRGVRKQVDVLIDGMRKRDGIAPDEPVPALQAKQWHGEVPGELRETEALLREAMDSFTQLMPLQVGDVVKVPLLMPHALQHGVRTVEFQTPAYERKILSFAQKVLTQKSWDTNEAVELMILDPAEAQGLTVLEDGEAVKREQIVSFPDFAVQRITLEKDASWLLPKIESYALVIAVVGTLGFGVRKISSEQAVFVPAYCEDIEFRNLSVGPCVVLVSFPR
ncbi:MAG: hypothetical protein DRR06_02110 [Gammaproteobacteria bacterium]|nr:MAG: hypothetical protein DRR06_02110 [Gammaproteobacteria bacterium]RLA53926.1 MAG: hypothetical protein DRR42_03370 [Gammaproteobacteria bacterium]